MAPWTARQGAGKNTEEFDPYKTLEISFGVSDSEVRKAYRNLARRLHPDKNRKLRGAEALAVEQKFQKLQEAYNFLTSEDHANDRREYDTKRRGAAARAAHDAERTAGMDGRRKRMRTDLERREAEARAGRGGRRGKMTDPAEALRAAGKEMREKAAAEARRAETAAEDAREKAARAAVAKLERRQVRLKWRSSERLTEASIGSLLNFSDGRGSGGSVKSVEISGGARGNQALVTFAEESAVSPCVERFAGHDTIRAFYVGKRKREAEVEEIRKAFRQQKVVQDPVPDGGKPSLGNATDDESRWRREAERDKIIQQMEKEDGFLDGKECVDLDVGEEEMDGVRYPPPFVFNESGLTPRERLEKLERIVLPLFGLS